MGLHLVALCLFQMPRPPTWAAASENQAIGVSPLLHIQLLPSTNPTRQPPSAQLRSRPIHTTSPLPGTSTSAMRILTTSTPIKQSPPRIAIATTDSDRSINADDNAHALAPKPLTLELDRRSMESQRTSRSADMVRAQIESNTTSANASQWAQSASTQITEHRRNDGSGTMRVQTRWSTYCLNSSPAGPSNPLHDSHFDRLRVPTTCP